ncbi:MAG: aldo/keto reductase [Paludibacteraceae bacterium]|nr:aldo/keto reductase [Paludibacteraceae bacterium]
MKTVINYFLLVIALFFVSINNANAQGKEYVPMLKLNNGLEMPQLGIGTFAISYEAAKAACLEAFKKGFRHVDCATAYRVEGAVGEAMKESGIPREEFFITSKLWVSDYANGKTLASIDTILKRFQIDYIDLLYIHQPIGDYINAWKEMEKAVASGKVRSLGISNFDASKERFHSIVDSMKIKPVALQIECHPYAQRNDIREWVKPYNIFIECWYPLGHGDKGLLSDPVIKKIADAHGKSIVQIILRWHIQEGFSVIPGATNPVHINENINIFDFKLSDAEMATMRSLNKDKRFFNVTLQQLDSWATGNF